MNSFRIKLILSIAAIVCMLLVLVFCWKSGPWNVGAALLALAVILTIWYLMSSDEAVEKETKCQPDNPTDRHSKYQSKA